jgi:Zn2+/Cd2+-exporting ATPase
MTMATATSNPDDRSLLAEDEQRSLRWRLIFALTACGCLILSVSLKAFAPDQASVAELVAGIAAFLVAVPALSAASWSLKRPDLHGVTDRLIAVALIAAWADGDLVTAALLPLIMMVGHILEERSLLGSQEAIRALSKLTEAHARRIDDKGDVEEVSGRLLAVGNVIELRPGDIIPVDCRVLSGSSSVDTASISGESAALEVETDSNLYGGSINLDGYLTAMVTRISQESALGRVVALLQEAELAKPPVTRILEHYAGSYLTLVLLLAAGVWFVTGSTTAMLAVLVASCPCALVLAAPATAVAAIAVASRHGILVKGAAFLESLASVDTVIFDKTGTLTGAQLKLASAIPEPGISEQRLLEIASSLGQGSSHPISRALAALTPDVAVATCVRENRGFGVVGTIDDIPALMGRAELLDENGICHPTPPNHEGPLVCIVMGSHFLEWLLLADQPRNEAQAAIDDLRGLGLNRQMLLTGDRWTVARAVAASLGIDGVQAETLPAEKMHYVQQEIASGFRPLVVGDGINDALALKAGAVGIAMGAQGTDVALASADMVLMTNDLRRLGTCIRLSRRCRRTIYVNVSVGLGWTVVIVACAATGVLGAGGALIAALLHNFSTLAVMANAGRLLKFEEPLP